MISEAGIERKTEVVYTSFRPSSLLSHVVRLWSYRHLLWALTWREVMVRYKQTLLGVAWTVIQPLAMTVVMTVVFSHFARIPADLDGDGKPDVPYPLFVLSGILIWGFFLNSINKAMGSVVGNMNLVTKIYFPREIFPISTVAASLVDFAVASSIFIGLMVWYRVPLHWTVCFLPLVIGVQVCLILAISLFMSAANVFYRDVGFFLPVGLQIWMYLSPVFYPISIVPEHLRKFYMLNPMAVVIDAFRRTVLLGYRPDASEFLIAAILSGVLLILAYSFFKRLEMKFADVI